MDVLLVTMHPREFLKELEESPERERLVDVVFEEMVEYCERNDIHLNELDNDDLSDLADSFVERGFGIPPSKEGDEWRKL